MIKRNGGIGLQPFRQAASLGERAGSPELQQIKMIITARAIGQQGHHVQVPRTEGVPAAHQAARPP
jgi:hypothetical protein